MARSKVFDEELVLRNAMNLFWEKGYNATSAQDLTESLAISRSSLYDTYGDKHSLFIKALRLYRTERFDSTMKEASETPDAEAWLRMLFESVKADALGSGSVKGCFMVNTAVELAASDTEVADIVNNIMADFDAAARKVIKKGQENGTITTRHSARALARFVFNALNGIRVTVKFNTGKQVFEDIIAVCLSALKA
ncbi:TetR/AcrR family transcriptional repressor of nem operon [Filimonas zeae]|uniref:TetR family transcriptional regulator n=1 Tax=Filimonas zeae TaxID=1737353 RepID=A0A917IVN1_9BACT|nr:TetR/AcrR family transcriptional regulator [Filimonas zeae]MDR6339227.1 TetR/AcrR family transcriptional repressor of nem operon [Filimonas zeae]GGH64531.1 TetR family transcriptional regulator [Filimonas zeae]